MEPKIGEFLIDSATGKMQVWTGMSWANTVPGNFTNMLNEKVTKNLPVIPNEMYMHASWPDWRDQIAPLYAAILQGVLTEADTSAEQAEFDSLIKQWSTFAAVSGNTAQTTWNNMPTGQTFKLTTPKTFAEEYLCDFSNSTDLE